MFCVVVLAGSFVVGSDGLLSVGVSLVLLVGYFGGVDGGALVGEGGAKSSEKPVLAIVR